MTFAPGTPDDASLEARVERVRQIIMEAPDRETALARVKAEIDTPEHRNACALALAEGALLGTEGRRAIWTDADYLVAIVAVLTEDGDRARRAAMAEYARRPVE